MRILLNFVLLLAACLTGCKVGPKQLNLTEQQPQTDARLRLFLGEWKFRPDLSTYQPMGYPAGIKVSQAAEYIRFDQWETIEGIPSFVAVTEACIPDSTRRLISV